MRFLAVCAARMTKCPPPAGSKRSRSLPMVRAELPQDRLVHLESKFQILERKSFVRRMRPAIGPREPKEKRFHTENIAKLRNDRNAAAFANQRSSTIEGLLQSALRCFPERAMRIS